MQRSPRASPNVLIVEDDLEMGELVKRALETQGFRATVAESGPAAIDAIERARFDAAVVDKELPGISGLDLVSFLRHRVPATPVILMTAFGGALVADEALARGAVRYLEKPMRLGELVETVRASVRGERPPAVRGRPAPARARTEPEPARLWAVVLAGGHGARLRPLTRRIFGDVRPKQFAPLVGERSMLRVTLDRVALTVPAARTVVVALKQHAPHLAAELPPGGAGDGGAATTLLQPADRGTAAGVLLAAHWIRQRDPEAIVAVFPVDHFVREDGAFMAQVEAAARFVARYPERLLVFGAEPSAPETEYGWIEPGEPVGWMPTGVVRGVRRLIEKPSPEVARRAMAAGALWNTLTLVSRASLLADAGRQFAWRLSAELARAAPEAADARALRGAYGAIPRASFSTDILANCAGFLAVATLRGVHWSDWGSPDRLVRDARQFGLGRTWLGRIGG